MNSWQEMRTLGRERQLQKLGWKNKKIDEIFGRQQELCSSIVSERYWLDSTSVVNNEQ